MRYETRFANGYWRVFDTHFYTTVSLHNTQAETMEAVDMANQLMQRRRA